MEVIKYYYGNDQSLTKTQHALMKIYPRELRNLSLKTIQRVVGKFERDLTLLPVRQTGRLKSVVTDINVEKIRRSLEERPRRSLRDSSKQTKLFSSLREKKLAEKLLVSAKWSASSLFQGSNGVVEWIKQTTVVSSVENLLARIQNLVFQEGSWFKQIVNY